MLRKFLLFFLFETLSNMLLLRCANPVTPQGGPKDEKPPRVLAAEPPPFSLHFSSKSIRIDFNEFIALKNPAGEIFISPPLKNMPETRLRSKSLILDISDTLKPNTTYSISFGQAITDLTEGNTLKGFSYVFSTGDYLDSLAIGGIVRSAFDMTPQKEVYVGLYLNVPDTVPFDSLPLIKAPFYITRTDENGRFVLNNLQNTPGRLFALADQNSDLFFNQPSEMIAFSDSIVTPQFPGRTANDTTVKADSVKSEDSINQSRNPILQYNLSLFEQADTVQRLIKHTYVSKNRILLVFRQSLTEFAINAPWLPDTTSWYKPEFSPKHDSVTLWITRNDLDSITLVVHEKGIKADTLFLSLASEVNKPKKGEKALNELTIVSPSGGYNFNQFKSPLVLEWSFPLYEIKSNQLLLVEDKDTMKVEIGFTDSLHRFMVIRHAWKEDKSCKLIIPGAALKALAGNSDDTLVFTFRTRAEKDFGNLNLITHLPPWNGQYIIQLLNEKENVIYEQVKTSGNETIRFKYLPPLKYKLKAIKDRNNNGKWDTGNYYRLLQPEEVFYLQKPIEIRANWDIEETWN